MTEYQFSSDLEREIQKNKYIQKIRNGIIKDKARHDNSLRTRKR